MPRLTLQGHPRTKKKLPPAEVLRQLLSYNPADGRLYYWPRTLAQFEGTEAEKVRYCRAFNSQFAGREAGHRTQRYMNVTVERTVYPSHRIIWKLVHGEEPDCVDHINGDGFDNRLCNLRNVSHAENMKNLKVSTANTSGYPGLRPLRSGSWEVRYSGKSLGSYATMEEALEVRRAYEAKIGHVTRDAA